MQTQTNKLLRCIHCDAYITGVEEGRWEGFARCPGCDKKMRRDFGADPAIPQVKGTKTKAWSQHREDMRRSFIGRAENLLLRGECPIYALSAEYSFSVRHHYARLIIETACA